MKFQVLCMLLLAFEVTAKAPKTNNQTAAVEKFPQQDVSPEVCEKIKKFDIDNGGKVNAGDLVSARRILLGYVSNGLDNLKSFSPEGLDVDGDDKLTETDINLVRQYILANICK